MRAFSTWGVWKKILPFPPTGCENCTVELEILSDKKLICRTTLSALTLRFLLLTARGRSSGQAGTSPCGVQARRLSVQRGHVRTLGLTARALPTRSATHLMCAGPARTCLRTPSIPPTRPPRGAPPRLVAAARVEYASRARRCRLAEMSSSISSCARRPARDRLLDDHGHARGWGCGRPGSSRTPYSGRTSRCRRPRKLPKCRWLSRSFRANAWS